MASNQQQAGSDPEGIWLPFIQGLFPQLDSRTYFLPPLHVNRIPYNVENYEGQTVLVHPSTTISTPTPTTTTPTTTANSTDPQVAGKVFVEIPAGFQPRRVQDSDVRDDVAQQRCLRALSKLPEQAMVVISRLEFRNYLSNTHNAEDPTSALSIALAQLPSIIKEEKPRKFSPKRGEWDIIILHKDFGILVLELESVGGGQYFSTLSPVDQNKVIVKKIEQSIKQLGNQQNALGHVLNDLGSCMPRVTTALLLPNISSAQLTAVLDSNQQLAQKLCEILGISCDVTQAVNRILCQDNLERPDSWWEHLTGRPETNMSLDMFRRLLCRFCGPASSVEIPTAGRPNKVLRSSGEAVAETGLRYCSLLLTLHQLALLNEPPRPGCLHLQGPPGVGKTVVLVLKALQWARRGFHVVLVDSPDNRAVTMLMEQQLRSILGEDPAAGHILRHHWDRRDVERNVTLLEKLLPSAPGTEAFIVFDEADDSRSKVIQWITAVGHRLPSVCVWTAGLGRWDNRPTRPLPPWMEVRTLTEPLRCPPAVIRQVETTDDINDDDIPRYTAPVVPPPTDGPEVRKMNHYQPGHSEDYEPWNCEKCADDVVDILRELGVGQSGRPQYRDTMIICDDLPDVQSADVLVRRLQRDQVPVRVVSWYPSDDDVRELAMAVTDQVIVTHCRHVNGLERSVVIALGDRDLVGDDYESCSRSTSFLCTID